MLLYHSLLTVGLYSSNYRVSYTIEISMTTRLINKCKLIDLFVCPSVCNANEKCHSSIIIKSRIIVLISGVRAWRHLQEEELDFRKFVCFLFYTQFSKNYVSGDSSFVIDGRIFLVRWRSFTSSTRKRSDVFNELSFKKFGFNYKNFHFVFISFVIDYRMIVDISVEIA